MRDLYSRLPDADIAGARGPGVVPGGEQGRGAKRGHHEQEGQPTPPYTYRPLGGAKQNFRGGSRQLTFGGPTGTVDVVVGSLVETPRDAGDDAEMITVTLGVEYQNQIDDGFIFTTDWIPIAVLEWGIGPVAFSAEIDWQQGTVVSLPASFVRVGLRVEDISGGGPADELTITYNASLAYGTPISSRFASPVRKTKFVGTIAAAAATTFLKIPEWSNSFNIATVWWPTTPDLLVRVFNQSGVEIANYVYAAGTNLGFQSEQTFPLPNGAFALTIRNNAAADVTQTRLIFNLAL